jgi:hypothetical protein
MNKDLHKKFVIRDEHLNVDWQRQRVAINERIAEREAHPHRGARNWAFAAAAVAAIALMTWVGMQFTADYRARTIDVAQLEQDIDEIIAGRLPDELYVVNDWTDVEITDWEATPAEYDPFEDAGNENGGNEEEAL